MVGGLIMCHGDDNGLRVPPQLAPIQAHVMVVKDGDGVMTAAAKVRDTLRDAGVRVGFDDRVDTPFGRRAVDAELKGYPVRIEIGPRDLAEGRVTVARRVDGDEDADAARRRDGRGARRARRGPEGALRRGAGLPRGAHRRRRNGRRGDRGVVDRLGPACRGTRSALDGEAKANAVGGDRTLPRPRRTAACPTPTTSRA